MIEPLLLTTARVSTFFGSQPLTGATGFFFERDARLFLVTSRHVMADAPSRHFPSRIEIELHTDADNLTRSAALSVLLYREGMSVWHQGRDAGGEIDVAVLEIERAALPPTVLLRCFTPAQLQHSLQEVEVASLASDLSTTGDVLRDRLTDGLGRLPLDSPPNVDVHLRKAST